MGTRIVILMATIATIATLVPSCKKQEEQKSEADQAAEHAEETLRVACGRKESLVGPLFKRFTEKTGIKVDVDYGKTPAVAMQLLTEGKENPAHLFYAQESGYLGALAKGGLLVDIPPELLAQVRPELEGGQKKWLAVSGRARVLVYNPAKVQVSELPKSLKDLSDARWKDKLGWAPKNGSFQAHVSALRHHWGEAKTEAWLKALAANGTKQAKNNSALVKQIDGAADIEVALVNHYYSHKLKLTDKVKTHSFPSDDGSNVVMISGIGLLARGATHPGAKALLEFMISEEAQKVLSQDNYEYPARKGMRVHTDVKALGEVKMTPVPQEHLTDVGPTNALLQKLGLN